ncbi:MAG: NADPH-dependent F420 reductase, partial [Chloroflexota bacterium]
VGGALGRAFSEVGHDVVFGVRDPDSDKTRTALSSAPGTSASSPSEAVAELPSLDARVVIDAMNRFGGDRNRSTADDLADALPGARVVKAFNTTGFENLSTGRDRKTPAAMFVAGDDVDAKDVAMRLAREIGFDPHDGGPLANAKVLEDMVKVWLALSQQHGRRVAFAISES